MFLVTFKTEKNLFHLTDPKPVLSQKLVNVTSTKYILQLALNRFAKSPIGYKAFEGKFRNFKRQYFFETFILKWSFVYSSWRMCFVLVTFVNVCDKTGFGSFSWNSFCSVFKVIRNMLKGYGKDWFTFVHFKNVFL